MPVPAWCSQRGFNAFNFCLVVLAVELTGRPCNAQTQQPFLFASDAANGKVTDVAVFTRNDVTGDFTLTPTVTPSSNSKQQFSGAFELTLTVN